MDQLPDDVLVELGRVTWVSLHLEDAVAWTSVLANPADDNSAQISPRGRAAIDALKKTPVSEARDEVISWLEEALVALDRHRNEIMHGRPLVAPDADGLYSVSVLGVMPRKGRRGNPARPYGERPLTVEHLRATHDALAEIEGRADQILLRAHALR